MSDARWTVDPDGDLKWDGLRIAYVMRKYMSHSPSAFDALVTAVHDADRLPERLRGYLNDPDLLADDIDAQIHIHCSDDGQSDEHNDWVHDLTGQIMKLLGFLVPPAPDTGEEGDEECNLTAEYEHRYGQRNDTGEGT